MELLFTMKKLWYYGQSYGSMGKKNYGTILKQLKLLKKFLALELLFAMEKLCYYEKNYGTTEKLWLVG